MKNQLENQLNHLLSDFHIFYQNVRGFHWNIKGKRFFELHVKFEEYYTEALTHIDEIAERILTLGGRPLHSFDSYLETSDFKVYKDVSEDEACVSAVKEQFLALIKQETAVKEMAAENGDHETEDMMISLINAQQKTVWMLDSWLS